MKLNLYNKNIFLNKIFEKIGKNHLSFNIKFCNKLLSDKKELISILSSLKMELNFINLDVLDMSLLLALEKNEFKILIDKTIFITSKSIKLKKELKYILINKSKLSEQQYMLDIENQINKLINGILHQKTQKNKNQLENKSYTDENLDKLIPFVEKNQYINKKIIAIGSSIGGVSIIEEIISNLNKEGKNYPPIVITQHITSSFASNIVDRLNKCTSNLEVQMVNGELDLKNNTVYLSNGENHMFVEKKGSKEVIDILSSTKHINKHTPSINALFRSVAQTYGSTSVGIILTGMGKDGIVGMGEIYNKGGYTIAQNKDSSVVHGIAGEAIKENFINEELSALEIVNHINNY